MHCTILKAAALLALNLQLVSAAWPAGNFTYMIPFAKGGGSAAAAEMQKKFTPAATLVYNGINSGATAWGNMKNDPKDGSVITLVNLPHIYIQPYIPSLNANYTPDDITIAYIHTYTPLALLVPANSTIQTWDDFVALCARKPVVISGAGTGTVFELGTSRLSKLAKIGITYESGGTGATAAIEKMVRGEYDAAWTTTPVVKGRTDVRTIAIASEFEFPAIDAPTFKTLGVNYVDGIYRGVGVPAGTPVSIVQEISNYFNTLNRNASFISMVQADNTALIFMPYNSASMNKFTANYRAAVNNDLFPKDPISAVSIYAMWILATLGIIACAAAAVFAFVFRNTPVIKGSSYFFNNIIIFGIMVAYSSMYVSSIHKPIPNVTRDVMSRACVALPWVLGLGFDITFAAILVKSYRLYRLFMFSAAKIVQFQATNAAIMKWVLGICGMNTLVYLVWTAHDPLYADLHSLDGDNTFYYSCTSKHAPAYLGTILSFKYIMLMGCIFFCIKLRDLNAMLNEVQPRL
ncbi:7 transmembrane sweet-taste receptor of 3 GCPR-domain-containing protein [Phlyctochytrium arcticum]|nr:7 transmembrane sweet-taste receptor of 3 GCPR-domain-containing protein [Phlyctochytrium arcticum]